MKLQEKLDHYVFTLLSGKLEKKVLEKLHSKFYKGLYDKLSDIKSIKQIHDRLKSL